MCAAPVPGTPSEAEPLSDTIRSTLKKYIQHIGECEGVDFIPEDQADQVRHVVQHFTSEELALLHELRREIQEDYRAAKQGGKHADAVEVYSVLAPAVPGVRQLAE